MWSVMPERINGAGKGSPSTTAVEAQIRRLQAERDLQSALSSTAVQALLDSENAHAIRVRDLQNELRAYGEALADTENRRREAELGRQVAESNLEQMRHPSARRFVSSAQHRLKARVGRYARSLRQPGTGKGAQPTEGGPVQ